MAFGLTLEPGGELEVAGLQVDAQPNPSPYRPSTDRGGVVARARFSLGDLEFRAAGPGSYELTVRIERVE